MTQMTLMKRLGLAMGGDKLGTLYRSIFPAADKLSGERADIAATIARSLDPDTGGYASFAPSEDGKTISCTTPCEPMFLAQAEYMMLHPEALHAAVSADYATRWPDLVAPTLADCEAFCAGVTIGAGG